MTIFVIIINCDTLFSQKYSHQSEARHSNRYKQDAGEDDYEPKPSVNYYDLPQNYQ